MMIWGAFMKVPTAMGNRAARLIDQLFFSRLLKNPTQGDGSALFDANHKNLLTGATSALSADSLQSGIQKFLDQTDADGQPISIEASYLLVPTALKFKAIELTRGAAFIATGSTDVLRPALNALAEENLQVVSSPYLGNSAYDWSQSNRVVFSSVIRVRSKLSRLATSRANALRLSNAVTPISILSACGSAFTLTSVCVSRDSAAWSKPTAQPNFQNSPHEWG